MAHGGARPGAGRKKGESALAAERMRAYLAVQLDKHFAPIVEKAIEQASKGDKGARDWLTDYVIGKPTQGITLFDKDDDKFEIADEQYNQAVRAATKRSGSDTSS